ncbi:MAG: YraN family protein [Saprospiraceae bacterium]|nr:YraN family protein [Saprospiraceae bacterium]MCF8250323.1 YraN family protein [Saprospiraceae bacterium]MCF8281505.1 YraN family protein [Bacteroidales bacterium]MCF8312131.1 YraN family protein [Saprospiraceae bacterium]MCF8442183.1 YraN family protein [Saprospiraceae bacterium]
MAKHLETGKLGEEIAVAHLRQQGFEILETNWRYRRCEVDIIAKEGNLMVFVEVKTRSYDYFGRPEEFVSPAQERRLAQAAAAFMEKTGHEWAIRFDVIAVLKKKEGDFEVELIRDAFFPGL